MRFLKFTLIEVVVALAVLGLAVVSAVTISTSAIARMEKAKSRWMNQHMMAQAAEHFLLAGPSAQPNSDIFPYRNVRVSCTVENAMGLPGDVDPVSGGWRLATYDIQLFNPAGQRISNLKIDKIIQVSDQ